MKKNIVKERKIKMENPKRKKKKEMKKKKRSMELIFPTPAAKMEWKLLERFFIKPKIFFQKTECSIVF